MSRRQKIKKSKKINFNISNQRLIASTLLIAYTSFIVQPAVLAQQIVVDGRTNTTVNVNGTISNVSTSTVHGVNAFNSFSRFNVYEGNTVNLVVPNSAANLINLVNGDASYINGILNSIKNGQIGGNVYLLNPDGVIFGKNSSVNVGSLNVFTPSKQQMDKYMDFNGNINDVEVGKLLDGEVALTDSGLIIADGKINAINKIAMAAGNVSINGDVLSGAVFNSNKVDFNDVVNVNGYNSGKMDMAVENGQIVIKAVNDVEISGKVVNDGANSLNAGDININAGNNIKLNENSVISAKGMGENSNGGNINIWADNNSTFNKNALIDVKGGNISGDAGFIELSAKNSVSLKGGKFEAYAYNGKNGSILIDPDELEITENNFTNGADLLLQADESIDIAEGIILSTRKLADLNSNHETALSTGNSGNLTLEAPEITVNSGAKLLSFANNGYNSGDITLNANANRNSPVYADINSLIDIGQNVVMKGNNISLNATADSTHYFDEDTSEFIETPLDYLDNFSVFAGYSEVKAESKINIGNGVNITSENDFTANAETKAEASITTTTTGVGVSVAKVDSDANIILGDNVSINSGKDVEISASNESKVNSSVTAYYFGDHAGSSTNITIAYGNMKADTKVDISSTSNLTAGSNININANTDKNMSVSATSNCLEDGKAGISVAVSTSEVNNTADVGGTLKAKNIEVKSNVTVVDKYDNYDANPDKNFEAGNSTKASTDVGSGIGGKIMVPIAKNTGLKGKMSSWFGDKDKSTTKSNSGGTKLALAGGVAYADHTNNSTVNIKDNSVLEAVDSSSDSGNIILNSETKEMVEVSAKSFVNPQNETQKSNAVSVAVAISTFNNNSETKIGDGSTLNASHDIEVKSLHKMPYHITWHEINGISDIVEKLNGDLGIQNGIFTTWARSTVGTSDGSGGSGDGIGIAGAVNIADFNSTSKAIIGNNVSINQDEDIRTDSQKLTVDAKSDAQTVNFSGIVGLTFFGTDAGKGGAGGSYIDIGYNNDVQAIINSGSIIDANYLQVNADSSVNNLSIAASASKAGKYAFAGSFGFLDIDNTTLAQIDSASTINVRDIDGFSEDDEIENGLELTATDYSKAMNITGGVTKSENAGIGASLSVSEIKRDTQAILGKNLDDETVKDNLDLTTDSDILLEAENTGLISTWGLAGAIVTNDPSGVGSEDVANKGGESGSGKFGLAVSGDVGISTIDETIKAYVNDVTLDTKAHNLSLTAISDNNIEAVSGSAALAVSKSNGQSVGIAGSYSSNEIDSDIEAFILNTDIENSSAGGDIAITADYTGDIWAISAGASGAIGKAGLAVAGSVSINDLNIKNSGYIKDSNIEDINDISLTSTNDANIEAYGGVLAGGSTAGVGAAFALNTIGEDEDNTNSAYITGSTISNSGNISLTATSNNTIETITGSVGVGKTAGIAVSVSLNEINNNTSAYIDDSSATSGGKIEIKAKDTSIINAKVAAAALAGSVSAGASIVTNDIENEIKAYINSSNIDATGDISLSSESDNTIEALSIAFSASGKVGLAGSDASNEINNETKSYITNSNGIKKVNSDTGNITLFAEDISEIKSIAGAAAIGGSVGFGGSIADNTISNETYSYVDNSSLEAGDLIRLTGLENELIQSISAAGAGAGTASAAGSVSFNDIDNKVKAYIANSTAVSDGILDLSATNYSTIKSINDSLAVGGYIGVSGGKVDNEINNDILAYIENSTVDSSDININAKSDIEIETGAIGVAGSGGVAASGSEAKNIVQNDIKAYILNSNDINSSGNITILAEDTSDIASIAGNAAFGGVGIGISIANNDIQNDIEAYISNSTVDADGKIDIDAKSTQEIEVWAVAGAASASFSGAASTSDIDIENNVKAYIADNSDIKGIEGIDINSLNTTENIVAKTGGVGVSAGAAFGGAKSTIDINNATLSYIDNSIADASAAKDISIIAESVESNDNKVLAGAASLYASAQASYSETNSRTSTKAYLGNDVTISEADDIVIKADRDVDLYSEALGGAAGAVAVGGSIARTNILGATSAYIGSYTDIGQSGSKAGSIDIDANSKTVAEAKTRAGAAGIASGNGSDARTNIETGVSAYIGNDAAINLTNNINIDTTTKIQSVADALGASIGGVSVGVSIAEAAATPTIETYIGNNANIEAKGINLTVNHNNGTDNMAKATAKTSVGALIGGNGSKSFASIDSAINAYIGQNASIETQNDISLTINSYNDAQSDATGRAYGLIAGGYTEAKTKILEDHNVYIKSNTVSGKTINAKNIKLISKATKKAETNADAGSGGLGSGVGSLADLYVDSNNDIYTENNTNSTQNNINTGETFVMDVDSTLSYRTTNNNSSTGIIAAGVPRIENTIYLDSDLTIGNYNNITTGGDLTIDGYNKISDFGSGYSLKGGASGFGSFGAGDSDTTADSTINALIGDNSTLDIGEDLNLFLNADSIISESAELVAKGAISVADIDLSIDIDNVLSAVFGANSTIDTYSDVKTYLKSNTNADAYIISECKSLAPIADGSAKANVYSRNLIDIREGATIRPNKDAYFVIGKDIKGNAAYNKAKATAKGESSGLLWGFGSVHADADVTIDNDIKIAAGANLTAGEDVNLISNTGTTYADGYSRSKSKFYLLFGIPITRYKHGGSSDTSTSNNIKIDGTVQSGLYHNRKLTIALDGTITEDGVNLDGTEEYEYNRTEELQVEIDSITDDIVEKNDDLDVAATDRDAAQTTLDTKNTELDGLKDDKTALESDKNSKISTKEDKIDLKDDKIELKADKKAQQDALDTDDEDYQEDYDALEADIDTLEDDIEQLDIDIATLDGQVEDIEGQISEKQADINTKNNQIDEAEADLDNKQEKVDNINTDIASLEDDKADLEQLKEDSEGGTTISALKVKPATIDSGYVNIIGNLSGSGTIKAPGNDFSIEVTNRTAKNMIFDILKINQNANGDIKINGQAKTGSHNGVNLEITGDNGGKLISINNAYDPDDPSILLEQADSSDLLFSKDIENLGGDLIIKNMSGSVMTQGLINAKNVFIYVPKGDYIHEFTKGRYITGGVGEEPSILYAGENIIISAQKIDINGTVQSGTDYRSVVINDFNPDTDLQWNDVTEKTELIPVTTKGENQDINGIKAVWDPDTQKIKLYRADIRGGNIVLQGEIISTGNGKLKVVSGYGEIDVVNNTDYDLEINQLNTNQEVNGKIYINNFKVSNADADKIVNKEITLNKYMEDHNLDENEISIFRDDNRVIHVNDYDDNEISSSNVTIFDSNTAQYKPNNDASYQKPATGYYWYQYYVPRSWWTEYWHGKKYNWSLASYSYTDTIAAKQPIGIEFLGKEQGKITIANNGSSDIYLKENVMNNSGDINISNIGGNIYNMGNSTIQSKNINLNAKNNIGDADKAIKTDLRDGSLTALSSNAGLINIEEISGQMLVDKVSTAGDVILTADGAIRATGNFNPGITGHNLNLTSKTADVGTISQDLLISTTGSLSVDGKSSVFIKEDGGDIKANLIKSEDGDVKITAASIDRDSDRDAGLVNISAKNITLDITGNAGNLSADELALFIDTPGDLEIQAGTDIHINALNDININKVYSDAGNVKLVSTGNITANNLQVNSADLDENNETHVNVANIKANNLDLISYDEKGIKNGGISNVNVDLTGIINAQAAQSIIISNTNHVIPDAAKNDINLARTYADDLRIGTITSESGDVVLISERSILDAKAGEDLNIDGANVTLSANLGSIGTLVDDLNIKSTGYLTASSYEEAYITSPNDLKLLSIDSSAKNNENPKMLENVVLKTTGNIIDGSEYEDYNIESKNITLNAAKIAAEDNYLEVNSDSVNATAPLDIYINETDGDLALTANSTTGNIMMQADKGALNASVIAGGYLRASAKNNIKITETTGAMSLDTIESTDGNIELIALAGSITDNNSGSNNLTGADITLTASNGVNSDMSATGNVVITATNGDIDADILASINSTLTAGGGNIITNTTASGDLNMNSVDGEINAKINVAGTVTSTSKNNTDIEAVTGDINVKTITSTSGDVTLTADNSILDALDSSLDTSTNISGKKLTLTAVNGSIGSLTRDLIATATDTINMTAKNDITVASVSANNTDMETETGDINVKTISSTSGDVTLTADNSITTSKSLTITDINNIAKNNSSILGTEVVKGRKITLTAMNGSIGSNPNVLRTLSTDKINMIAKNNIYTVETFGDLISDSIIAENGSIGIGTAAGDVIINHISAADLITIIANGNKIDIETIDPKKIDLNVLNAGGLIDINKALVAEEVKLIADNIKGTFVDTDSKNPLSFYMMGINDSNVDTTDINVNAGNFEIEKFASNKAKIFSHGNNLNWKQVKVGSRFDINTPKRSILIKNKLGLLEDNKDIQIYAPDGFYLTADANKVETNAKVLDADKNQSVNPTINNSSNTGNENNNENMSKTQEDIEENLNPTDMRDQSQNIRDSLRYNINADGVINIPSLGDVNIKVTDISSGGAGISIDKDIPIGEEINLAFNFNGLEINTKSKVVSKEYDESTGTYKLGLKFTDIPPEIAEQIPYACMSL